MNLTLSPEGDLSFESALVSLHDLRPVLNDHPLEDYYLAPAPHPRPFSPTGRGESLRYSAPALGNATFVVEVEKPLGEAPSTYYLLRYWLEGLDDDLILDSFGLRFERVENLRAYLRHGYFSWDGSFYVEPEAMGDFEDYEARPETGYGMTQLLPSGSGIPMPRGSGIPMPRARLEPRAADPVLVQVRVTPGGEGAAVFIFNVGDLLVQRTYSLASLGLSGPLHVFEWTADRAWPQPVEQLSLTLPAHEGALLFLSPSPIAAAPEQFP